MNDRIPPNDLTAEASVLGECLLDPDAIDTASQLVDTPMFYAEAHQRIWGSLASLRIDGIGITVLTLSERLLQRKELDDIGGLDRLNSIMAAVPCLGNVVEHCGIVRDRYRRRVALNAAIEIMGRVHDVATDTDDVLNAGEAKIHAALEGGRLESVSSAEEVILDYLSPTGQAKVQPIPTTWPRLDEMIGGFTPGQLAILAARTSGGKSAAVTTIGTRMAEAGFPGLIVSYEMSKLEIMERMLLPRLCCDLKTLRTSGGNPDFRASLLHEAEMIGKLRFYMDESKPSLPQLLAMLRTQVRKQGIRFAVIDYLQLIPFVGKAGNREQEIAQMTRQLKAAAGQLGIVIIALSQLNRGVDQREDKRPRLADLRESGAIEQDADVVLLLWRPYMPSVTNGNPDAPPDNVGELIIAKQRGGQLGVVQLSWDGRTMTYRDRSEIDPAITNWGES